MTETDQPPASDEEPATEAEESDSEPEPDETDPAALRRIPEWTPKRAPS